MKNFSKEEKQQMVERYYAGESVSEICSQTGIARSTFYTWLKSHKITTTNSGYKVSSNEFIKMVQRLKKLEDIIEVLKRVNCTNLSPLKEKLPELALLHAEYSVHVLSEVLNVSRVTYYNYILRNKKRNTSYQVRRAMLSEKIKEIYHESNQIYGANKIKAISSSQGVLVSEKMVAGLMREMNLFSIRTDPKKQHLKYDNDNKKDSLKMNFNVKAPNEVWVSDITYYKFNKKDYYICVILDLYSRKVISCKISQNQSTQLTASTFKSAFSQRNPNEGLIFHIFLCYYPIAHWKNQSYGYCHFYGNIHQSKDSIPFEEYRKTCAELEIPFEAYNVGCLMDHRDFIPRTFQEIVKG